MAPSDTAADRHRRYAGAFSDRVRGTRDWTACNRAVRAHNSANDHRRTDQRRPAGTSWTGLGPIDVRELKAGTFATDWTAVTNVCG
jgi:hypothetical protein